MKHNKDEVVKELCELGKQGKLGKDWHISFRKLSESDLSVYGEHLTAKEIALRFVTK